YHDIENIYNNIDSIKGKLKEKLISSKENVFLSKELVKLYDVPLHCKLNEFETKQPNNEALYSFFSEMEFKQFLQDIQLSETGAHITEALRGIPESFLSKGGNAFFYSAEDKVYIYDEVHDELLYEDKENFAKILNSFDSKKIITFDIQSMPDDIVNILRGKDCFDIKIAAYLADSGLVNYQIETLSVRFLSEHLPGNDFIAKARYVYLLYQKLKNVLKEDKTEKLFYDIEMPLLFILHDMKKAGVYFDLKKAKKIEKKVAEEMDGIRKEIFDEAGEEFNLNSPSQIGHILFEKLKLPVIKKNKTGFSTGEEVLEKLSKDFKIAGHILEYRKLNKLSGTYITPLEVAAASDGYIHANFNQTVTQTGRLSSSSPNLQSIPAKGKFSDILRSVFKSSFSDGSLLACDYSQIELVIMAHFSGEKNLLKAFSTGEDVHTYTAALLFDIKKDEVTPAQRAVAKRVNFGVLYGMGQYGLARELDISPFQAQQFIDNYFLRYSDVEKYLRKVEETAQKNGYITTILGRRRYFPDFKNTNKNLIDFAKRQAVNTPIQGSCADIIKQAMVNIASEFDRRKLKARLIMQIHDELIFDVPKNELKEVKSIAKKCMETAVKLNIPIKVKIKEGPDWGSMKEVSDAG
ncbi:MAG: DNA polymerase, partial [Candidatus Omnitrophica bacterium]|nr:DNA polymerase [Candidatus Omnitrophota bacterium]